MVSKLLNSLLKTTQINPKESEDTQGQRGERLHRGLRCLRTGLSVYKSAQKEDRE